MGLKDELKEEANGIFENRWTTRDGTVVPDPDDVALGNDAVKLGEAVVLYADLVDSTDLVDRHKRHFAAEVYKAYLYCAARVIRAEGAEITAYDGDRIMAVYLGGQKNTSAAKTALKINYVVREIINPAIVSHYGAGKYVVKQAVGVDKSDLFVARTGVRGDNDLVWVGPAANYAAKLCSIREDGFPSFISEAVYNSALEEAKVSTSGQQMWEQRTWKGKTIYRSSWRWDVDFNG
jgi:class 3 adenylate cyclase